ncbi:hypothetical protein [Gallaecimonas sp. GXIMD1310]|uniref:hypothetical protein n=1 Tax=Gallaecimonas sp. GXIMD1310 TaxID=3131926 RepID=UPI00324E5E24
MKTKKILIALLAFALVFLTLEIFIYFNNFGFSLHLSKEHIDWSNFYNYLNSVVTPTIGIFTFISFLAYNALLVETSIRQSELAEEQNTLLKNQSKLQVEWETDKKKEKLASQLSELSKNLLDFLSEDVGQERFNNILKVFSANPDASCSLRNFFIIAIEQKMDFKSQVDLPSYLLFKITELSSYVAEIIHKADKYKNLSDNSGEFEILKISLMNSIVISVIILKKLNVTDEIFNEKCVDVFGDIFEI